MPSTETSSWIDAPVGSVVAIATDPDRLTAWFRPVAEVRAARSGDLGIERSSLDVDWALGTTVPARLSTVRRIRDVVHLDLSTVDGKAGRLCFAFSPWDGGTAIELRADLDGWRLSRPRLRRALLGSLRDLAALAERADATYEVQALRGDATPSVPVVRGARLSTGT